VDSLGVTVVSVVDPSVVLVSVVVDEVQGGDINDGVKEITLIGEVDEAGFALLKEQLVVEKSKKTEQEKLEKKPIKGEIVLLIEPIQKGGNKYVDDTD